MGMKRGCVIGAAPAKKADIRLFAARILRILPAEPAKNAGVHRKEK